MQLHIKNHLIFSEMSEDTDFHTKINKLYQKIQPDNLLYKYEGLFYIMNQFFYSNDEEIKYYIKQKYQLLENLKKTNTQYEYYKTKILLASKILSENTLRQAYQNKLRVKSLIHQSCNLKSVYKFRMSRVFVWNIFVVTLNDFESTEILEIDYLKNSAIISKPNDQVETIILYGSHIESIELTDNLLLLKYRTYEDMICKHVDYKIKCFYEDQTSLQKANFELMKIFKKDFMEKRCRPFHWKKNNNQKKCFTFEESDHFFELKPNNYIIPILDDRIIPLKSSFQQKAMNLVNKKEVWLLVGSTCLIEAIDSNFKCIQNVIQIDKSIKTYIQETNNLLVKVDGQRVFETKYEFSSHELAVKMMDIIEQIQKSNEKSLGIFLLEPQCNNQVCLSDPLYDNIV